MTRSMSLGTGLCQAAHMQRLEGCSLSFHNGPAHVEHALSVCLPHARNAFFHKSSDSTGQTALQGEGLTLVVI